MRRSGCCSSGVRRVTNTRAPEHITQPVAPGFLSPFPNWFVRWPNRALRLRRIRRLGRIGIIFRCGLPRQTCELAASADSDERPAGSKGPGLFFVEDVKRRQAYVPDFLFTKNSFVVHAGLACQTINRRRCQGCFAAERQRQPGNPESRYRFTPTRFLCSLHRPTCVEAACWRPSAGQPRPW